MAKKKKQNDSSDKILRYLKKVNPVKKFEFTKIIVAGVMIAYYIGVFYSIRLVEALIYNSPDSAVTAYTAWLTFLGLPVPVVIGFYCWKSKCEYLPKIMTSWIKDTDDPEVKKMIIDSLKTGDINKLNPTNNSLMQVIDSVGNIATDVPVSPYATENLYSGFTPATDTSEYTAESILAGLSNQVNDPNMYDGCK